MPVSYTCPNPDCGVTLKTPNRVAAGKSVKCPKCNRPFVPEPEPAAGPGTYGVADDPTAKAGAPKSESPPAATSGYQKTIDMDDEDPESVKQGYAVEKESEEEMEKIAKNKPKFTEVQDKFKKSARGPAQALLVMPSNLLTFEGIITVIAGLVVFVYGMWPLVFNDAPPGEEELEEAILYMLMGVFTFAWGATVCYGASQMQELGSYPWAMVGSIMGLVPLLVGLFGIIMLLNPKVKAGFEEMAGAIDEDDEDDDEDKDTDTDDDDDDDGGGTAKKVAKKVGRKVLGRMLSGDDDDDDEAEEDADEEATSEGEDEPKKRRKRRADDDDD